MPPSRWLSYLKPKFSSSFRYRSVRTGIGNAFGLVVTVTGKWVSPEDLHPDIKMTL
ncbi:hypothetical protein N183_33730 [Sinorhizobium sp. Sb3]|nr:hypothetical protein N183_33730 [Sinorhizobium sp. Sb3]